MKKIVALGAAAALVGGLFAAEPASNPSVVSFTGNASVEWGVDLDAGKTGFKNDTWTELKLKLFDAGDKATSGDGVWAELVLKVDGDSDVGPNGYKDGAWLGANSADTYTKNGGKAAYIDVAKLHFNNIYVGIKSGDTQTGELGFTTAVHSEDPYFHPALWLKNVGPADFSQGIVAGYEDDNMNIAVDFRSLSNGQYTNAYAVAGEFKIKDSNSFAEGLAVGLGASYNLSKKYYTDSKTNSKVTENEGYKYTLPYSIELPDFNGDGKSEGTIQEVEYDNLLGYSASVGYKFKIDDKYWLKPQVGLTGVLATANDDDAKEKSTANLNTVAAGFIFAWGDTAAYGSTGGVYFFGDDARGFTPGVSVMAYVPLAATVNTVGDGWTSKTTLHDSLKAMIVPSFYSGNIVENLSAAVYSEIGLFEYKDAADRFKFDGSQTAQTAEFYNITADGKNTTALALAAGLKYDIKADDITISPKASVRYANTCYVENKATIDRYVPASGNSLFKTGDDQLGIQDRVADANSERNGLYAGDFFNLEAGVDVAGLINNTTFSCHYKSANLLNKTNYSSETIDGVPNTNYSEKGMYNVKLGTFNVGCKISF